ncbi:hypothetical protein KP509_08G057300 [Ceratopteris richardii]|uniref:Uncharacterized protein n=1 Tax=Ceratopteris richardii TaxID=49495 RepID=A0A8T2U730_CERRI|nr:hypothetical protein KP509_08G057300 [Ceratopteris richardii]
MEIEFLGVAMAAEKGIWLQTLLHASNPNHSEETKYIVLKIPLHFGID